MSTPVHRITQGNGKETAQAPLNRRAFLKGTAAAVAGIASGPMILPRRVLGMNGQPGANDRIVLGAIGVGIRGPQLFREYRNSCDVAAVADVDMNRAREIAESFDADQAYQDYRELLDRNDVDAVVLALPAHWHSLCSIHAAQAGKDVYCEKPMSRTIEEGRKVVEAVRKYNCVFQTGSQQRSGRNEHTGITHVRNGTIGKVTRVIAANYRSPQRNAHPREDVPEGLDWDLFCGPAQKLHYNWSIYTNRQNAEPCWSGIENFSGGDRTDWGSHGLDLGQWGLDMDASGPEEVWVEGEPFEPMYSTAENPGGRRGGPNSPKVFMKFPGDIVMECTGGVSSSGVRFIGEEGSIQVTRGGFSSDPGELTAQRLESPEEQIHQGYQYALDTSHMQDWLKAIKERRDPVAPVEAGHRTATVCHLGNIARWVSEITGETGNKLKWDAQAEQFTNSPQANRFVNPVRRKGYELPEQV